MKNKLIAELKSFFMTFLAVFAVEAYTVLLLVYNGDWTVAVLQSLGMAALRSSIKAMLQLVFPKLFPSFQDNTTFRTTTTSTSTNIPITTNENE
jgi:hypothetical protein